MEELHQTSGEAARSLVRPPRRGGLLADPLRGVSSTLRLALVLSAIFALGMAVVMDQGYGAWAYHHVGSRINDQRTMTTKDIHLRTHQSWLLAAAAVDVAAHGALNENASGALSVTSNTVQPT